MRFILFLLLLSTTPAIVLHAQVVARVDLLASCDFVYDSALNRSYYTIVDKMPAYKGGLETMLKVIGKNVKWPGAKCCIEGSVFLSFIIEADGTLTNKRVLKGFGDGTPCDANKEALKVLDFLTDWIPGRCYDENVAVKMVIPIRFQLAQPIH